MGLAYAKRCSWLQWICAYNFFDSGSVFRTFHWPIRRYIVSSFFCTPLWRIFPKTIFLFQITPAHINNSWPYFLYRLGIAPWWFPLSLKNIPLANEKIYNFLVYCAPLWRKFPIFLSNAIKWSIDMSQKFGLDPMSNFGIFRIFAFRRKT